ncbi:MAG: hypothetical protein ACYSWP_11250 [Planctomycetota bacterium]|jgi:hypothetical protein
MKFVNPQTMGKGGMSWTVVFQELNGDVSSTLASGSHDKLVAWEQAQKTFKNRVLALIPGNHQVVTQKDIS